MVGDDGVADERRVLLAEDVRRGRTEDVPEGVELGVDRLERELECAVREPDEAGDGFVLSTTVQHPAEETADELSHRARARDAKGQLVELPGLDRARAHAVAE